MTHNSKIVSPNSREHKKSEIAYLKARESLS